jgi:hypothetical protein
MLSTLRIERESTEQEQDQLEILLNRIRKHEGDGGRT